MKTPGGQLKMANKKIEELSVDICVIGGAGAGLIAALRAVESGAKKVIILEKMKSAGGCTWGAAGIFSVESPAQKRLGLNYSIDDCYKYHMDMSNWYPDAKLVRNWMTGTGQAIGWLETQGCRFDHVINFVGVGMKRFYHQTQGGRTGYTVVQTLLKACREKGVEIRTETRATKLLANKEGAVVGVLAAHGDEEIKVFAKGVIIATGSISSNKALLARFYPGEDLSNVKIMANVPHNSGDGLLMAEAIGAASTHMSTLFIGPHNHPYNERTGALIRRPNVIHVNCKGERFADEAMYADREWGWMLSMALHRQPGKMAYALIDESILRFYQKEKKMYHSTETMAALKKGLDSPKESDGSPADFFDPHRMTESELTAWLDTVDKDIQAEEKAGRLKIAQSLDEIAQWIGCDPQTLKTTIADYNSCCRNHYDADFLKDPQFLLPLTTPPYYAIKGFSGIDTCIGGLRTNHRLQVLNNNLDPIKGLYAAGVVVGNWLGLGYSYMGSEMSFTTYSGWAVGKNAAEYVNGKT
jgi:fumarate reductase flavoprotein subunit